ncbi:hypothetical protein HK098_008144 [Nowakowskiella sp. JEL0407]|nr:hypothetical protein HK098_008144 [Nowakowskiella sp. JEL0407]
MQRTTTFIFRSNHASFPLIRSHILLRPNFRPFSSAKARPTPQPPTKKEYSFGFMMVVGSLTLTATIGIYSYIVSKIDVSQYKPLTRKFKQDHVELRSWSGQEVYLENESFYTPSTFEELEQLVLSKHKQAEREFAEELKKKEKEVVFWTKFWEFFGWRDPLKDKVKIRPMGSGISVNGLSLEQDGMVNLTNMNKILNVDTKNKTVRVQAGITVAKLAKDLKRFGLTIPNIATVLDQQIGGLIQTHSHGTGATRAPLDDYITAIKIVTPALGILELSSDETDPTLQELFKYARSGLGRLGIIAEVEMKCVDAHKLKEEIMVVEKDKIREMHPKLMNENLHLKYIWIPHTPSIVVIKSNPVPLDTPIYTSVSDDEDERKKPLYDLYYKLQEVDFNALPRISRETIAKISAKDIRDRLYMIDPTNKEHVKLINEVSETYWKSRQGVRVDWSEKVLSRVVENPYEKFEVAFPATSGKTGMLGKYQVDKYHDLDFMFEFLQRVEENGYGVHDCIEQTWSAASSSPLSPAFDATEAAAPSTSLKPVLKPNVYSWVGVGMYLPNMGEKLKKIKTQLHEMRNMTITEFWDKYGCMEHWSTNCAKSMYGAKMVVKAEKGRKAIKRLHELREILDPYNILGSEFEFASTDHPDNLKTIFGDDS